ncbi:hypothetical protein CHLRE_10g426700v5 [Chlamydomonas reinhardtii]|uniref:Cytochrome P450, CYP85 clan n=1 Tax=Chlamydomonas reinhardtii TaxID=3055 RepID=A0A2K3D9J9_CHLRE|nr:uncharacterized protein CHLRE_10g426700v5 [Chlamydomonas reinhardtii]PNW77208.1 hypothetical protein CHLRE_10g426700v5 [Chlamydomonas reinhardtii]
MLEPELAVAGLRGLLSDPRIVGTLFAALIAALAVWASGIVGTKLHLPGPYITWPFLGDAVELGITSDLSRLMFSRFKKYGRVFRLNLLGHTAFVVSDEAALRGVLSDDGAIATIPFRAFSDLMGEYGTQSVKEIHGPWRKLIMAAVNGRGLSELVPGVAGVMARHVAGWAQAGRVELFQASHAMGLDLSTDVIANVHFTALDRGWFKQQMRTFTAGMWGLPVRLPGSDYSAALAAKERLIAALMPEMRDAHAAMLKRWEAAGRSGPALAAALLEEQERQREAAREAEARGQKATPPDLSIKEAMLTAYFIGGHTALRDAPMTILNAVVAAADTTRFSLFTFWAMVAMSTRVQEEIFGEQQRVVAAHGPELTPAALSSMPYLEACFKEAMRLLPTGGGAVRHLTKELKAGSVTLPAGEWVWYHPHLMHCIDPVLWDGDTSVDVPAHMDWRNNFEGAFRPERWLSEETKPKYYFTFGSGVHLCAGVNLVYLEAKLVMAMLVRRFRLRLSAPDMLARCTRVFPFMQPVPGTDKVELLPREQPLPVPGIDL